MAEKQQAIRSPKPPEAPPPMPTHQPNRLSALVRGAVARRVQAMRAEWTESRALATLNVLWNIALVVASVAVLVSTSGEQPTAPLRPWVAVYAVQCVVHASLVSLEYRRWSSSRRCREVPGTDSDADYTLAEGETRGSLFSITKQWNHFNTMASFIWWMFGFYWLVFGGDLLRESAPTLYWLTAVFLAFDVFFVVIGLALAGLMGIALLCCLPFIIIILYIVPRQGASDGVISSLPKYKFKGINDYQMMADDCGIMVPLGENQDKMINKRVLSREDMNCCICSTSYKDGVELICLPCKHHFHSSCIVRWLRTSATCALCRYNIRKGNAPVKH